VVTAGFKLTQIGAVLLALALATHESNEPVMSLEVKVTSDVPTVFVIALVATRPPFDLLVEVPQFGLDRFDIRPFPHQFHRKVDRRELGVTTTTSHRRFPRPVPRRLAGAELGVLDFASLNM
jgi:hypothetical protein